MDDLISRQQAIDAIDVLRQEHRYKIPGKGETYSQYNEAWQDSLDRAEGAIFNLPPAQPEPHWIPVSERLPSDGTWNIFTDGKNISVERYKADAIDHFFPNGRWFQFEDAIAWMSLPEAYKPNK
jgi:hypothetical protein